VYSGDESAKGADKVPVEYGFSAGKGDTPSLPGSFHFESEIPEVPPDPFKEFPRSVSPAQESQGIITAYFKASAAGPAFFVFHLVDDPPGVFLRLMDTVGADPGAEHTTHTKTGMEHEFLFSVL
jgi:hypothetical protein